MHFSIGDVIHLEATNEQGRIIRLFKSGRRVGYIVATTNQGSEREIEALWFPREIKETRERVRRYRRKAEPLTDTGGNRST
jgi:hypothetical protein